MAIIFAIVHRHFFQPLLDKQVILYILLKGHLVVLLLQVHIYNPIEKELTHPFLQALEVLLFNNWLLCHGVNVHLNTNKWSISDILCISNTFVNPIKSSGLACRRFQQPQQLLLQLLKNPAALFHKRKT